MGCYYSDPFFRKRGLNFERVQWPSRKEVRAATIVVISLVTIIALYLFLVDWVLSWLFQAILEKLNWQIGDIHGQALVCCSHLFRIRT